MIENPAGTGMGDTIGAPRYQLSSRDPRLLVPAWRGDTVDRQDPDAPGQSLRWGFLPRCPAVKKNHCTVKRLTVDAGVARFVTSSWVTDSSSARLGASSNG